MCTSRLWWILWMLEYIHWLMFHQFARSYAVTSQCYHIHLILIINNAQLTIYALQGFQSLLQLAEKHCSNLLLFNLQLWGRKWPKEWFNTENSVLCRQCCKSVSSFLAGKFQPLHQVTFFNCINLRDIMRVFFKIREGITSIMNEESVSKEYRAFWSSSTQLTAAGGRSKAFYLLGLFEIYLSKGFFTFDLALWVLYA